MVSRSALEDREVLEGDLQDQGRDGRGEDFARADGRGPRTVLLLAEEHQPALILMDIRLPGMDGTTALGKLKLSESTQHIPVIAVTASVMPSERDELLAAGFDGFQPKPVNLKELLADMRTLIERTAGQQCG